MNPGDDPPAAVRDRPLDYSAVLKLGFGVVVAGVILYLLGEGVGWDAVRRALAGGEYHWLAIACASTFVGLIAWSKVWHIVFAIVDIEADLPRVTVTYLAATFANYVTPFGQVGGEPLIAYVLSRDMETSYEDSFTGILTADLLNLVPFFSFAVLGLGVLLQRTVFSPLVRAFAYGLAVLAVTVLVAVYVGWRHRGAVRAVVSTVVGPASRVTNRLTVDDAHRRVDRFYASLETVTGEPDRLLYALLFSFVGWVFFSLPLFFAGLVLGIAVDPLLVLFIVPASTLAGVVPTPGGLGGVETALVALLVGLASLTGGQAFALAVLYRLASYWFTVGVGGLLSLYVVARM